MSYENPNAILIDSSGNYLPVQNGAAIPASTPALIMAGSDGTNSRYMLIDSSGRPVMVGAGTAGTPAGGVLSIQGVTSGTAVTVAQATAANLRAQTASESATGAAVPTLAAMIGGSVTTAAPTYTNGNLGALSLTTTGLLRIDGSGVTQPVSGTVTANQGGAPWSQNITQFGGVNISTGTGASGTGIPRVTVANDSNILATQSGTWTVQPGNTANTTPWLVTDSADGPVTPGAVAGKSNLMGGQFNTTLPTLTNTQQSAVQLDGYARQIIVGTGVAGTPTGGVLTVQGVAGGTVIPVSITSVSAGVVDTTSTGTLNALNATASIVLSGTHGAGMQLLSGTLVGTIVPEISYDNGTTWVATFFDDPTTGDKVSSIVFGSSNTATSRTIVTPNGTSNARVRVSAFTSGSATCNLRATAQIDPTDLFTGVAGGILPPTVAQVGGTDGTVLRPILTDTSGNVGLAALQHASFSPDPKSYPIEPAALYCDDSNNLQIRGQVLTDEGSFRDDFSGSGLTTAVTGTLSFTNGSATVTGSGTTFTTQLEVGDFIKKTADSETLYLEILSIDSDTSLTLEAAYAGTTASGVTAVYSNWKTSTPTGGTITVTSSVVSIAPGTTNGNACSITRNGDYLPYVLQFYGNITQRIANQVSTVGFRAADGNAQASVVFDGTDNTKVKLRTAFSSAAADTQDITVTIPNSGTSAANHLYEIDLTQDRVTLLIDGYLMTSHSVHLPAPYASMNIVAEVKNNAAVTATTLNVDMLFFQNIDNVQTSNIFSGSPDPVQVYGQTSSGSLQGVKVDANGSLQVVIQATAAGTIAQICFGDVSLSSITTAAIARTTYTEQTTNFTGSIVSSSANDTAAGTGARTVRIYWMDSTGVTVGTEDVTLNGTTNVNLVTSTKCYIEKMEVLTVGSTGSNVGIITLRTGLAGGGTVVGTIAATDNKTFWAHHYVQSGKTCSITGIIGGSTASTVGAGSSFALKSIPIGATNQVEKQVSDTITLYGQANQVVRNYTTAIPVSTGPARLRMYVTTLSSTSIIYRSSFDFADT